MTRERVRPAPVADLSIMTFVEFMPGESEEAVSADVRQAYASCYSERLIEFQFGKEIAWKNKSFREVCLLGDVAERLMREDRVFLCLTSRVTVQVGTWRGILFETPLRPGDAAVARVRESGWESLVEPFVYETKT
jgi:hypothetical protein